MKLYICGSNRNKNCYKILNDLKLLDNKNDKLITLSRKNIKYCLGCSACIKNIDKYCVQKDDMQEIYDNMIIADKIIIASPVYMNHITGILKNMIDRLNPFSCHGNLKGKKVYLILTGQMSEKDNEEIIEDIKKYFNGISEFMEFEFKFIKYLSSGDVESIDDISKCNKNYEKIVEEMKNIINE